MSAKIVTFTATSDASTGIATVQAKIPGTFVTIDPTQPTFTGRQLLKLGAWFEARAMGDRISSIVIKDIDGVYTTAGTVLGTLHDTAVSSSNQGLTLLPQTPFQLDFPGNIKTHIASGLYVVFTFQKQNFGLLIATDTAVVNLAWDDFT